jgi:hypothetical protein
VVVVVVGASNTMLPNLSGLALPTEGGLGDKAKELKDRAAAAAKDAADMAKEAAKAGVEQAKREKKALEEKLVRAWVKKTKLTRSTAPDVLFKKANEIYKKVHKKDIPKDQADKMRKGLSEAFGTPLVGLRITGGDAVWTSSETAEERRLREEADQKVLEKSAIEFFLCFLVWCFDMAVGSEGGAGPMCRQYGF